jgi:hypothetical protein
MRVAYHVETIPGAEMGEDVDDFTGLEEDGVF